MLKKLTPRAIAALSVVAVSFFATFSVACYGATAFSNPHSLDGAGAVPRAVADMSAWLAVNVGAGAWALLLLPMVWGAIVYFEERTPDLVLRAVGTLMLAVSISTIWSLAGGSRLWGGHIGNAVAGALGSLNGALGFVGTGIGWLLALAMLAVSVVFATEWGFYSLRRGGRTARAATPAGATEAPVAELRVDDAPAEARAFVVETPRAAVAAAAMDDIVESSPTEALPPHGWDTSDDDGRTVLTAPSGYRGVEFLPPSEELALPEPRSVTVPSLERADDVPSTPIFSDDEFVATPDAAFFRGENDVLDAAEEPAAAAEESVIADAVEELFEAVTEPGEVAEPVRASGIGLPEESPFADEFFASGAGWPFAEERSTAPSDGATAASEGSARFATAPEPVAPAAEAEVPAFVDEELYPADVFVSRLPAEVFDEVESAVAAEPVEPAPAEPATMAEPVAEITAFPIFSAPSAEFAEAAPSAFEAVAESPAAASAVAVLAAPAETEVVEGPVTAEAPAVVTARAPVAEPQLTLFAETRAVAAPVATSAPAAVAAVDLAVLHTMELDPLFRDAVGAVLERGRASAVVLQRQLGIGYARGIRILDQMTAAGLTGPDTPTGTRELRVTRDAWAAFTA